MSAGIPPEVAPLSRGSTAWPLLPLSLAAAALLNRCGPRGSRDGVSEPARGDGYREPVGDRASVDHVALIGSRLSCLAQDHMVLWVWGEMDALPASHASRGPMCACASPEDNGAPYIDNEGDDLRDSVGCHGRRRKCTQQAKERGVR